MVTEHETDTQSQLQRRVTVIAGQLNSTRDSLPVLGAGEIATIARIDTTQVTAKRLADMGFVRGARIEMLRPGKPCLVRIGSACVGLGAAHQDSILLSCQAES